MYFPPREAFIRHMPPCHTKPFVQPGIVIERGTPHDAKASAAVAECCDYCGAAQLVWRKCKLICEHCRQINKSCADL